MFIPFSVSPIYLGILQVLVFHFACAVESSVVKWPAYDTFWHEAFASYNATVFSPDNFNTISSTSGRIMVHSQTAFFRPEPPGTDCLAITRY